MIMMVISAYHKFKHKVSLNYTNIDVSRQDMGSNTYFTDLTFFFFFFDLTFLKKYLLGSLTGSSLDCLFPTTRVEPIQGFSFTTLLGVLFISLLW